jgi:nucleoside-diphosphate-sugar epimerase
MRVFVTGGSGFVGRRLVKRLVDDGHEAVCLSRSGASSAMLDELGAEVLSGDLTNPDSIKGCVLEARPTHVAHLAAEIATQRSKDRIALVNVTGTRALIDACRELNLEKFLFLSTVVRGNADGQTFTEEDPIPATTEYGRSKAAGDDMVLAANREWGLPGVILRPSHIYGAGGWLSTLLGSKVFRIPGAGENLWDMVHVDDVVSACVLLLEKAPSGQVYHVVDDEPVTMKDFFGRVTEAMGRKPFKHAPVWLAKIAKGGGPIASAVRSAKSSNEKLKSLGWVPQYPRSKDAIVDVVRELHASVSAGAESGDAAEADDATDAATPQPDSA